MNTKVIKRIKLELLSFIKLIIFYGVFLFVMSDNKSEVPKQLYDLVLMLLALRIGFAVFKFIWNKIVFVINRKVEGTLDQAVAYNFQPEKTTEGNERLLETMLLKSRVPMLILKGLSFQGETADYLLLTRKFTLLLNIREFYGTLSVKKDYLYQNEKFLYNLTDKFTMVQNNIGKILESKESSLSKKLSKRMLFNKNFKKLHIICDYKTTIDFSEANTICKRSIYWLSNLDWVLRSMLDSGGTATYSDKKLEHMANEYLSWSDQEAIGYQELEMVVQQ